jgi:hypothetical protein
MVHMWIWKHGQLENMRLSVTLTLHFAVLLLRSDAVPSRTVTNRVKMPHFGGGPYKNQGSSIEKMLAEAKWRLSQVDSMAEAKRVEMRRKEQVEI